VAAKVRALASRKSVKVRPKSASMDTLWPHAVRNGGWLMAAGWQPNVRLMAGDWPQSGQSVVALSPQDYVII
jgi:hypothetical protein